MNDRGTENTGKTKTEKRIPNKEMILVLFFCLLCVLGAPVVSS
jgi:hypothetical protein